MRTSESSLNCMKDITTVLEKHKMSSVESIALLETMKYAILLLAYKDTIKMFAGEK